MKLRVRPLKRKDAGSGFAAIDREAMQDLGVTSGEFVTVAGGDGRVVARVWPGRSEDTGSGVVRIDGGLRKAVGARVDDRVEVEPADVSPAERVRVALPEQVRITGDVGSFLGEKLTDQPVASGQTLPLSLGLGFASSGRRVPVTVLETEPGGTVVVRPSTEVEVVDRAADQVAVSGGEAAATPEARTPSVTYEDIGGLDDELERVREMIELPMRHPELFQALGIEPPKGVLLHGPPGTGKTLIARAVASEIDAHFQSISGPEIMSKYYGESEEQLREVFEEAEENEPAIVFIDEIDSIAPEREEAGGDVERRVVSQLLSLMDGLDVRGEITVIGATNRVDAVDPALRRPGRFDREIEIGVPDRKGREEILHIHTRGMPLGEDVDLERYAEHTHGFVGADLENLTKEAAMTALRRIRPDLDLETEEVDAELLEAIEVTEDDFRRALRGIEPSALREVFVETPDVGWDDVGGLAEAKARLREAVEWPLEHADAYDQVDLDPAKGILLFGPPGTGKTLLAKAVASEADANFISVKGPELFDKYVGESEKGVREVFDKARENAPTVVFFDEMDALAAERGSGMGDSNVGERVVSQLLTELDGLEELEDVVVVAATNRPDLIDAALLRPGRFERHIPVREPDEATREEIFEIHTREKPLAGDVDLADLAERAEGYVGADIEAVCREAATIAVREHVQAADAGEVSPVEDIRLEADHFDQALEEVSPDARGEFGGPGSPGQPMTT